MRRDHIVQRDHIALAPFESHCVFLIDLTDMVHNRILNWGFIAVVNVARQVFPLENRKQRIAYVGVETMHVVQLHLIEKRNLSGYWMPKHAAATLLHPEVVFAIPLSDKALLGAGVFHHGAIFRMKK